MAKCGTFVDSEISLPPFGVRPTRLSPILTGTDRRMLHSWMAMLAPSPSCSTRTAFKLTSTVLSEIPAKVVVGESVTFSAAVTSEQGTATGNVTLKRREFHR